MCKSKLQPYLVVTFIVWLKPSAYSQGLHKIHGLYSVIKYNIEDYIRLEAATNIRSSLIYVTHIWILLYPNLRLYHNLKPFKTLKVNENYHHGYYEGNLIDFPSDIGIYVLLRLFDLGELSSTLFRYII